MSDDEKCFIDYHRVQQQHQQMQQHQQIRQMGVSAQMAPTTVVHPSVPQIKIEPSEYSPSASPVYQYQSHPHNNHHQAQFLRTQQQQQTPMGHSAVPPQYASVPASLISVKSEPSSSSSSTSTPIPMPAQQTVPTVTVAPRTSSSSHIHLWQFLKVLLSSQHQYGSAIRWLDRSKGVFKIEDSVRVAQLWGARKNRPAMNYDKLSRSIRQYYKKGIMKKTERSQRLVYQFCQPYSL